MCNEAEEITDQAKREELYAKTEKHGIEKSQHLFLYQMSNMMAMRENVKGDIFHANLIK